MNKSRGFTIIELIVVIAIIAVLAAIVLVNVTQYINKGKDAAIKGNLATLLTNSAVYFDANAAYNGFNTLTTYSVPSTAITNAGGNLSFSLKADNSAICFCSKLNNTNTFCVDSTGGKGETSTACGTRCTTTTAICS